MSPPEGDGITGLDTYLGVVIPDDHSATLSAGGLTLDVEIDVDAVIVDWGDGGAESFPSDPQAMAGFPDGIAIHVYEVKSDAGYVIAVSYDWTVRWRVTGGPWIPLDVPNTTTSLAYPVAEIVSVITD